MLNININKFQLPKQHITFKENRTKTMQTGLEQVLNAAKENKIDGIKSSQMYDIIAYFRVLRDILKQSKNNKSLKPEDIIEYINLFKDKVLKEKGTCYFEIERERYKDVIDFKKDQDIYEKVIQRCFDDIDKAVLSNQKPEIINKLYKNLEIFTTKYGHYAKLK